MSISGTNEVRGRIRVVRTGPGRTRIVELGPGNGVKLLTLIESGRLSLDGLITHRRDAQDDVPQGDRQR